jgi:6,7-dimethyl-8-ribityllumazine synthase
MSTDLPRRPPRIEEALTLAIVASEYNGAYVDGLIAHATMELAAIAPNAAIETVRVPGSYEIPIAVKTLLAARRLDAVLAFGLIFDGETMHASLIANAVTQALMQLSLEFTLPILHEVLVMKTEKQAAARCLEDDLNRGTEAARAVVRVLTALGKIRRSFPCT